MFGWLKRKKVEMAAPDAGLAMRRELVERVIQALGVSDDDTVLEIGFGDAVALRAVLPYLQQGRVAGIDSDSKKVKAARLAFPAEYRSFRADFREGVASRLPYPDEHFTKVFALDSVGGWLSIPKGLSEIKRVLFPLGRVVFSLPPKEKAGAAFVPVVEVKGLLQAEGFENVEILRPPLGDASVIILGQKPL
jgi:ubiquinone/menaquinone biosynthesis C-methylase UbiE